MDSASQAQQQSSEQLQGRSAWFIGQLESARHALSSFDILPGLPPSCIWLRSPVNEPLYLTADLLLALLSDSPWTGRWIRRWKPLVSARLFSRC